MTAGQGQLHVGGIARGLVKKCVNEIGGGLVVSPVHRTHTVDVDHAARDVREQLRGVEPLEGLLRDEQRLLDHRRRVLHLPRSDPWDCSPDAHRPVAATRAADAEVPTTAD